MTTVCTDHDYTLLQYSTNHDYFYFQFDLEWKSRLHIAHSTPAALANLSQAIAGRIMTGPGG